VKLLWFGGFYWCSALAERRKLKAAGRRAATLWVVRSGCGSFGGTVLDDRQREQMFAIGVAFYRKHRYRYDHDGGRCQFRLAASFVITLDVVAK